MNQTKVQNSRTIRFGSGLVEAGEEESALINLGAMVGITFSEEWEAIEVQSDNAGKIRVGTANHVARLSGELQEINLQNLQMLRGNIDNFENIPGTLVEGAEQTIADWAVGKFIKIEHQNGDGSAVVINSVTGETALAEGTDYIVAQNEYGETGIIVQSEIEAENLVINYDYTPNKAIRLSSGGKTTIEPRIIRVTNRNEQGKKFQITIFKAKNQEGINIELPSDSSGEIATCPINLMGELDDSRAVGSQLFEIYDEQGVY